MVSMSTRSLNTAPMATNTASTATSMQAYTVAGVRPPTSRAKRPSRSPARGPRAQPARMSAKVRTRVAEKRWQRAAVMIHMNRPKHELAAWFTA